LGSVWHVAYSADIKSPGHCVAALSGFDARIVDVLQKTPHPSHFNLMRR
jgi:hypothetical protein